MSQKLWCAYVAAILAAVASLPVAFLIDAWAGLALAATAFVTILLVGRASGTSLRVKRRR